MTSLQGTLPGGGNGLYALGSWLSVGNRNSLGSGARIKAQPCHGACPLAPQLACRRACPGACKTQWARLTPVARVDRIVRGCPYLPPISVILFYSDGWEKVVVSSARAVMGIKLCCPILRQSAYTACTVDVCTGHQIGRDLGETVYHLFALVLFFFSFQEFY